MSDRSQQRRERVRQQTVAEIKTVARQHLVSGGPAAISLRAIARDMGMTAPALYRYFPSLDSLVLELCTDLYTELRLACEAARDQPPTPADPVLRLQQMAREFRRWALAHPGEVALMFGPPLPGVELYDEQCRALDDAGGQFGAIFIEPLLELHAAGRLRPPPNADRITGTLPGLPEPLPNTVHAVFLISWTRIYGVIAAESFGHMRWATDDAEPLFEAELAAFAESLLPPS